VRIGVGAVQQQRHVQLPRSAAVRACEIVQLASPNSLDQIRPLIRVDDQPRIGLEVLPATRTVQLLSHR
jgi:hypothetical protein